MKPNHSILSVKETNLDNQAVIPFGIAAILHQYPDEKIVIFFDPLTQLWEVAIEGCKYGWRFPDDRAWKLLGMIHP